MCFFLPKIGKIKSLQAKGKKIKITDKWEETKSDRTKFSVKFFNFESRLIHITLSSSLWLLYTLYSIQCMVDMAN